jgi:hypothetical protein
MTLKDSKQPRKVKWLVTSRNEVVIEELLDKTLTISLEHNLKYVNKSVDWYVVKKVEGEVKS